MEDLISKKELLQLYGISYGALYRWKRMGLIPEAWFLRRATPTGQETFFHRGQICPRMDLILSRGESVSLEALAEELREPKTQAPVRRLTVQDGFRTLTFTIDELRSVTVTEGTNKKELLEELKGAQLWEKK